MLNAASHALASDYRQQAEKAPELVCISISAVAALMEDNIHGPDRLRGWLTPTELRTFQAFSVRKRRLDWLAGRLAAKETIRASLETGGRDSFRTIEIVPSTSTADSGRPRYTVDGHEGPLGLSICHAGDIAAAALACDPNWEIGIDLERVRPREASLESVALSDRERHQLRSLESAERHRAVTLIWVMKESLLKALGVGLRMPLGQLTVHLERLQDCSTSITDGASYSGVTQSSEHALFSIEREADHLHPLLPKLGQLPMRLSTFSLEDALGCWVMLPTEEESWRR